MDEGRANAAILANYSHVLFAKGKYSSARCLLERCRSDFPNNEILLHLLATACCQMQDLSSSARYFRELVTLAPSTRIYRTDAAQVLCALGRREEAREVCRPLLDRRHFSLPDSPQDFFCDGLANWVLGDHQRAEYDFERSGMPAQEHYRYRFR